MRQVGKLNELFGKMWHRTIDHALRISQSEFSSFIQRTLQGLIGLKTTMRQHHSFEIGFQRRVRHQRGVKAPPNQRFGGTVVFKQLVI